MMQIDWMMLSYVVIAFFAIIGFFRGWWKEAITLCFLTLLILLLQYPDWAQRVIDWINAGIAAIWPYLASFFSFIDGTTVFQLDASRASTWLVILFLLLGFSAFIARLFLPGTTNKVPSKYYTVTMIGRLLGLLFGGVNGFLFINFAREYLDGRNLPGNTTFPTEITIAGGNASVPAASNLSIQVVNLPNITILDSYIPWLIIGTGLLVLVAVLWSRVKWVTKAGAGSKIDYVHPYGYKPLQIDKPKKPEPQEVKMVS
jgi:hypothetical protein